jgi:macrolide-specific efflux system membrane fusion protein
MRGNAGFHAKCTKKVNILISVVFISTLFSACSFGKGKSKIPTLIETAKFEYRLYEVKRGNIESILETNGVFVSNKEKAFSFKVKYGVLKKLNVQAGDHVKKGQIIAELDTTETNNNLQKQEIKIKKVQLQYDKMLTSKASDTDMKQILLDLEEQKYEMQNIQEEIGNSKLISTVDGRVVKSTQLNEGEHITGSDVVVTIAEDNSMNIECFQSNISKFKLNMNVNFSYNNKEYIGIVTELNILPVNKRQKDEIIPDSMIIKINEIPSKSHLGEFVRVYSKIDKKENVIIAPIRLVRASGAYNIVEVFENGKRVEKNVEVGIANDKDIEIISGLKEGEKLIE